MSKIPFCVINNMNVKFLNPTWDRDCFDEIMAVMSIQVLEEDKSRPVQEFNRLFKEVLESSKNATKTGCNTLTEVLTLIFGQYFWDECRDEESIYGDMEVESCDDWFVLSCIFRIIAKHVIHENCYIEVYNNSNTSDSHQYRLVYFHGRLEKVKPQVQWAIQGESFNPRPGPFDR